MAVGIKALDQVSSLVIAVVGDLAQRQDFPYHPVVGVVFELMGVTVGVVELNQVASCVIKRLGLVAEAVVKLGQLVQGTEVIASTVQHYPLLHR